MWRGLLAVMTACGSSTAPPPDGRAVALVGTIYDWLSPTTFGPALPDAMVCVWGTSICTQSDGGGNYALYGFPPDADSGVAVIATGHLRTVAVFRTPMFDTGNLRISVVTDAVAQQKVQDAGGTVPLAGTGIVEVGAFVASGSTFIAAAGATDAMTGHTAVYLGIDGYPDRALTATSSEGGAMFVNVPPGMVEITVTLPGKSCVLAMDGWHGSAPGTVSVMAEPDTLTYAQAGCN